MAAGNFQRALPRVLVHEGAFVNHPDDPGGATLQGITQGVYTAWRRNAGKPARPLSAALLRDPAWPGERDIIYRLQYWDRCSCDDLPAGVDYVVFDGAVNSGPVQSAKWLQRALGVRADGVIGEVTTRAAAAHPDHDALVAAICERRMAYLKALRTWSTFGRGWTARVAGVRSAGQAWATGRNVTLPVAAVGDAASARALISDARPAPATTLADAAAGAGVGSGTAAGVLQQAQDALAPLAGSSGMVATIVACLALAGVGLTLGGLGLGWWQRRRAAAQADALDLISEPA